MAALCAAGKRLVDMTEDLTYNGWSNRESWLASLWLTNDPDAQSLLYTAACLDEELTECAAWLANQLREQLEIETSEACLWSDLMNCAFSRINV